MAKSQSNNLPTPEESLASFGAAYRDFGKETLHCISLRNPGEVAKEVEDALHDRFGCYNKYVGSVETESSDRYAYYLTWPNLGGVAADVFLKLADEAGAIVLANGLVDPKTCIDGFGVTVY